MGAAITVLTPVLMLLPLCIVLVPTYALGNFGAVRSLMSFLRPWLFNRPVAMANFATCSLLVYSRECRATIPASELDTPGLLRMGAVLGITTGLLCPFVSIPAARALKSLGIADAASELLIIFSKTIRAEAAKQGKTLLTWQCASWFVTVPLGAGVGAVAATALVPYFRVPRREKLIITCRLLAAYVLAVAVWGVTSIDKLGLTANDFLRPTVAGTAGASKASKAGKASPRSVIASARKISKNYVVGNLGEKFLTRVLPSMLMRSVPLHWWKLIVLLRWLY